MPMYFGREEEEIPRCLCFLEASWDGSDNLRMSRHGPVKGERSEPRDKC